MTTAVQSRVKPAAAPRVCLTCRQPYVGCWSECARCVADFIAADMRFDRTYNDR